MTFKVFNVINELSRIIPNYLHRTRVTLANRIKCTSDGKGGGVETFPSASIARGGKGSANVEDLAATAATKRHYNIVRDDRALVALFI